VTADDLEQPFLKTLACKDSSIRQVTVIIFQEAIMVFSLFAQELHMSQDGNKRNTAEKNVYL